MKSMGKVPWSRRRGLPLVLAVMLGIGALAAPVAAVGGKLVEQIRVAVTHATFSLNSQGFEERLLHAHHVVNILEGAMGPHFDASKGNPGDGYGALNYAMDDAQKLGGTAADVVHNTMTYLEWANQEALAATQASDYATAGVAIHRALAFLSAALGRPDDQGPIAAALALGQHASESDSVVIEIYSFQFGDGKPLTIRAGTTVTWINHDNAPHTATGDAFNSGTLHHGDSFSFTFTETGVYEYVCAFHPRMTHTIIVE